MKGTLLTLGTMVLLGATAHAQSSPRSAHNLNRLLFVENKGQITDQAGNPRQDIHFRLSAGNMNAFISKGEIHYQWNQVDASFVKEKQPLFTTNTTVPIHMYRLDMELMNADLSGDPEVYAKSDYYENYYLPQLGPEGARARSFEKVVYKSVYPNIDWVLYIKEGHLEHDFVLHPGANVADIKMKFSGTTDLIINDDGSFTAVTPFGSITEAAPYSYQEDGKMVASSYALSDNTIGFSTAAYNGKLTIDPTVSWSTYIGGDGLIDETHALRATNSGDLYVAGQTMAAANIATTGAHQTTYGGFADGVLMKFTNAGTLIWSTYYGGEETDLVRCIDQDSLGNVYIAGISYSATGIASPGSHQSTIGGVSDLFFAKFDSTGTRIFGSYYGGPTQEFDLGVKVAGPYFYISGSTTSETGIASAGSAQSTLQGGADVFVAKFNLNGVRQWGTYVGGDAGDDGGALSVDPEGNVYLFGRTRSANGIATAGAHKSTYSFATDEHDHFLVKLNSDGVKQWGTYHGGEGNDMQHISPYSIDCDAAGNVYITSSTLSTTGISTAGAHQVSHSGGEEGYLAKFNSQGQKLWGTYLGGEGNEVFTSVSLADSNTVYMVGMTTSTTGIATANALQSLFAGGVFYGDAFVAQFNSAGNRLYGSYFGSTGTDGAITAHADHIGNLYIAGLTNSSSDISTPGSYLSTYPGALAWAGFVVKFCFAPLAANIQIQGSDSVCSNSMNTFSVPEVPDASEYIWTLPPGWDGSSTTNTIDVTSNDQGGVLSVQVIRCSDSSVVSSLPIHIYPADIPVINENNSVLSTLSSYVAYQWLLNDTEIPGATAATLNITEVGDYRVVGTNEQGCTDTSAVHSVTELSVKIHGLFNQVSVFPNPTSGQVNISSPVPVNVTLTDMYGKVLQQPTNAKHVSVGHLAEGMYFLQITDNKGQVIKTVKISKQ